MKILLSVFIGGGFGSVLRFLFQQIIPDLNFPWPTFTANFISCFILGFLLSQPTGHKNYYIYKTLLMTGFCGGLSTYSGFIKDEYLLWEIEKMFIAVIYGGLSFILCMLSMLSGMWLGKENHII